MSKTEIRRFMALQTWEIDYIGGKQAKQWTVELCLVLKDRANSHLHRKVNSTLSLFPVLPPSFSHSHTVTQGCTVTKLTHISLPNTNLTTLLPNPHSKSVWSSKSNIHVSKTTNDDKYACADWQLLEIFNVKWIMQEKVWYFDLIRTIVMLTVLWPWYC